MNGVCLQHVEEGSVVFGLRLVFENVRSWSDQMWRTFRIGTFLRTDSSIRVRLCNSWHMYFKMIHHRCYCSSNERSTASFLRLLIPSSAA
jgi:hypothetical protein